MPRYAPPGLYGKRSCSRWPPGRKLEKSNRCSVTTYRKASKDDLKKFSQTLQQNPDKVYMVTVRSGIDNPESYYYAFIVKLGKNYYLDYYPADKKETENADAFFKAHYIPMHGITELISKQMKRLKLKQLDGGYLEKLIRNKQIRIQHEVMPDGDFMITASTEELQKYLIKYSDVPEAYDNGNASDYTKVN